MAKWRKLAWLVPLLVASHCVAQDWVQSSLYLAFNQGGPIALGRVLSVNAKSQGQDYESGTLTMEISEQLRGEALAHSVDIPFAWSDPNSPSHIYAYLKRAPASGFDRVRPVANMHVLVIFPRRNPAQSLPITVLNLDAGEDSWIPLIKRAIAMASLSGEARVNSLISGLSDPSKFIRVIAMHGLLEGSDCLSGSSCRDRVVATLAQNAKVGSESDRLDAIDWLAHRFYDASAQGTNANRAIVESLLAKVTDASAKVRGQAISDLDEMLSPDMKWHPDLSQAAGANHDATIRALRQEEQAGGQRGQKAKHLADAISTPKS